MPYIQESEDYCDVCVVGSGTGVSMAAKVLAEAGAKVLVLKADPEWSVEEDGAMFEWNFASPRRGASTTDRPFGEFDACIGGREIDEGHHTATENTDWSWFRGRMLGGRTYHWGRISLRFGLDDFDGKSINGHGEDWPIDYSDLRPCYDRMGRLVGIFSSQDGFYNEPGGIFTDPPEPRCYEKLLKQGAERIGIPVLSSRVSTLTEVYNGRSPCRYCAQCNRECTTHEEGQATGVSHIDPQSRREYKVRCDVVVLVASSCDSARLLLNSPFPQHPDGLVNSSDTVGRYLMDSSGTTIASLVPQLMGQPAHNCEGVVGMHIYIPWRAYDHALDFPQGSHLETWGGCGMPGYSITTPRRNNPRVQDNPHGRRPRRVGSKPLLPGLRRD